MTITSALFRRCRQILSQNAMNRHHTRKCAPRTYPRILMSVEQLDLRIAPAVCTWTGNDNNDWTNALNWAGGIKPTNGNDANVRIPEDALRYPRIPDGTLPITITSIEMDYPETTLYLGINSRLTINQSAQICSIRDWGTLDIGAELTLYGRSEMVGVNALMKAGEIDIKGHLDMNIGNGDGPTLRSSPGGIVVEANAGLTGTGVISNTGTLVNDGGTIQVGTSGSTTNNTLTVTGDVKASDKSSVRHEICAAISGIDDNEVKETGDLSCRNASCLSNSWTFYSPCFRRTRRLGPGADGRRYAMASCCR